MGQMHVVAMDGVGRSGMCRTLIDMHHYVHPNALRLGMLLAEYSNISHEVVRCVDVQLTNLKRKELSRQAQEAMKSKLMDPMPLGANWWGQKAFHYQIPIYNMSDVRAAMERSLQRYRRCFGYPELYGGGVFISANICVLQRSAPPLLLQKAVMFCE
jgi:hypothetical protein